MCFHASFFRPLFHIGQLVSYAWRKTNSAYLFGISCISSDFSITSFFAALILLLFAENSSSMVSHMTSIESGFWTWASADSLCLIFSPPNFLKSRLRLAIYDQYRATQTLRIYKISICYFLPSPIYTHKEGQGLFSPLPRANIWVFWKCFFGVLKMSIQFVIRPVDIPKHL